MKLLKKTFDLCEEAYVNVPSHPYATVLLMRTRTIHRRKANASIQCPVQRGDYVIEQTVSLPKEIPPGASAKRLQVYTRLTVAQPSSRLTFEDTLSTTRTCFASTCMLTSPSTSLTYGRHALQAIGDTDDSKIILPFPQLSFLRAMYYNVRFNSN